MSHKVGAKGQVVIEKELRDRLGIKPGWLDLQRFNGGHIEIFFIPPELKRSFKGIFSGHIKTSVEPGQTWEKVRESVWKKADRDKMKQIEPAK